MTIRGAGSVTVSAVLATGNAVPRRVALRGLGGAPLLGPDGLHPSLAGQQAIARAVVECLTA